jgi:hypothetical protein
MRALPLQSRSPRILTNFLPSELSMMQTIPISRKGLMDIAASTYPVHIHGAYSWSLCARNTRIGAGKRSQLRLTQDPRASLPSTAVENEVPLECGSIPYSYAILVNNPPCRAPVNRDGNRPSVPTPRKSQEKAVCLPTLRHERQRHLSACRHSSSPPQPPIPSHLRPNNHAVPPPSPLGPAPTACTVNEQAGESGRGEPAALQIFTRALQRDSRPKSATAPCAASH